MHYKLFIYLEPIYILNRKLKGQERKNSFWLLADKTGPRKTRDKKQTSHLGFCQLSQRQEIHKIRKTRYKKMYKSPKPIRGCSQIMSSFH